MKKAFVTAAIFTMTGILFAGCSAITPSADMTDPTEQPTMAIVDEAEEAAPDIEDIVLSDSTENDTEVSDKTEAAETALTAPIASENPIETKPKQDKRQTKEPDTSKKSESRPVEKDTQKSASKPAADTGLKIVIPSAEPEKPKPVKTEPTPQPEKPDEKPAEPTPAPTPDPTAEPTPEPEPQVERMGGGFNGEVLAAVNEARALSGNAPLSLDGGLCEKAAAHAEEMARQGKAFHSCGGVESVSDSNGSGRTIGTRSAVHASDLELNAGLTRLGVGSVKINGKQYTCVIAN